jgi:hypothetical protein
MRMMNLLVRGLNDISSAFYWASHTLRVKTCIFLLCAIACAGLIWTHAAQSEDTTIYSLSSSVVRGTLVNRYVRATGHFLFAGAYDVRSSIAGFFWQTMRFVPLVPVDSQDPLLVLDENLLSTNNNGNPVTLVGKIMHGEDPQPMFYMRVMDPPPAIVFDIVVWACFVLLAGVCLGVLVHYMIRKLDYALTVPVEPDQPTIGQAAENDTPLLLWFGGLGPAYGDVSLRQISVSFKAIPAEARLTPTLYPELWSIVIRHLYGVQSTRIATSYGALPAMRLEFEDERGIIRNGVIAASNLHLIDLILDVLRFVGQ